MELIEVNNVTYACEIHQRDKQLPCLLMLHGFMGDHRVFDHLKDELCHFCNPIAIDLLGFGSSSKPSNTKRYHEENQVADIITLIEKMPWKSPFLHGYSMGGRLGLKMALKAPELFQGFIFESSNCGISDPSERKERQWLDRRWAKEIENDFSHFLGEWKKLDLFQSSIDTDELLVEKYHHIQSDQKPTALAASLRGFGTGSMTSSCDRLAKLHKPVLLMAGSEDEKYQQINKKLVPQFPNARFSSIPGGHRTHLDNPEGFLSELKNFIDTNTIL